MGKKSRVGYREIGAFYENMIRTGKLESGAILPPEVDLSKKHKVTRTTIRRAFDLLVRKGMVKRLQGRGTYVADKEEMDLRQESCVLLVAPAPEMLTGSASQILADEWMYRFLESLTMALARYGRPFRFAFFDQKGGLHDAATDKAPTKDYVGVIALGVFITDVMDQSMSHGVPTVFVDCITHGRAVNLVKSDNFEGSRQATEHLLKTVHGPLAFVGGLSSRTKGSPHGERLDGFLAAHAARGIEVAPDYIMLHSVSSSNGLKAAAVMSRYPMPPAGYVCSDDDFALGVVAELEAGGISVPGRVSVFGFGDKLLSRTATPSLSTVTMDHRTMALKAVELLHELTVVPSAPPQTITVPVKVQYRQTTIIVPPVEMYNAPHEEPADGNAD